MARYFFHLEKPYLGPDKSAFRYPNDGAAKKAAVRYTAEILRDNSDLFLQTGRLKLNLTDSEDHDVLAIEVSAIH